MCRFEKKIRKPNDKLFEIEEITVASHFEHECKMPFKLPKLHALDVGLPN